MGEGFTEFVERGQHELAVCIPFLCPRPEQSLRTRLVFRQIESTVAHRAGEKENRARIARFNRTLEVFQCFGFPFGVARFDQ